MDDDPSYTQAVDPWVIPHTRRSVLAGAAATAVVVLTPRASWAGPRLDTLSRSAFAEMLGQTFTLSGPLGTVRATLDEVGDVVGAPRGADGRFSLLFRAPSTVRAADGTYTVANRRLGSQPLFLVPVDRGASARLYQAIVNRT